ncbi:hypothetical protein RI367_007807 [Sorochytrium milnesiophthora]
MSIAPPPQSHVNLLLQCLSSASVLSTVIPYASLMLKHRITFMSAALPLAATLNWSSDAALTTALCEAVDARDSTAEPVLLFRRVDQDTLECYVPVQAASTPTTMWIVLLAEEGAWRFHDIRLAAGSTEGVHTSVPAAEECFAKLQQAAGRGRLSPPLVHDSHDARSDDDDYWASYSYVPDIPSNKPRPTSRLQAAADSDGDYWAAYDHSEPGSDIDQHDQSNAMHEEETRRQLLSDLRRLYEEAAVHVSAEEFVALAQQATSM